MKSAPSPTEFTIGHNVADQPAVDALMSQAERAGARILKPAHETFWGGVRGVLSGPRRPHLGSCLESALDRRRLGLVESREFPAQRAVSMRGIRVPAVAAALAGLIVAFSPLAVSGDDAERLLAIDP